MAELKKAVHDFWNSAPCGVVYATGDDLRRQLAKQAEARYAIEPYIARFAQFEELGRGRDVLEIGVGMGADHLLWARSGAAALSGVDLTEAAIEITRQRLELENRKSNLRVADAENLPFADETFDVVYSFGVMHHSPDTGKAIGEAFRVLRPGGTAKIMIYHSRSIVGGMLWLRYGARSGLTLQEVYGRYLESPGTKAYSRREAGTLLRNAGFADFEICFELGPGDLLLGEVGQRHRGPLLKAAKLLWPRWAIRRWGQRFGLEMLITARKE